MSAEPYPVQTELPQIPDQPEDAREIRDDPPASQTLAADRFEKFLETDLNVSDLNLELPTQAPVAIDAFVRQEFSRIQLGLEATARATGRQLKQPPVITASTVARQTRSLIHLGDLPQEVAELRARGRLLEEQYASRYPQIAIARELAKQLRERQHWLATGADNLVTVYSVIADERERQRPRGHY